MNGIDKCINVSVKKCDGIVKVRYTRLILIKISNNQANDYIFIFQK